MAKSLVLEGPTSEKPYTVFENEENSMVYVVQEHLVGKIEDVRLFNGDGISLTFTGLLKIYVSMQQSGVNAMDKKGVTLEYGVIGLSVLIRGWPMSERFSWPIGDTDLLSTLQKLSEVEASQGTTKIAIHSIQPMFNGMGDLMWIEGKLLAILE